MIAEASQPGASVADVARRHGVNANLLFNWCRLSRERASAETMPNGTAKPGAPGGVVAATDEPGFIPIGVFGRAEGEGPALIAGPKPVAGADTQPTVRTSARPALDERPGAIAIDLVDGTRLRVDAFVNERSLRRVLTALRASS